jgi:hypothetical protein
VTEWLLQDFLSLKTGKKEYQDNAIAAPIATAEGYLGNFFCAFLIRPNVKADMGAENLLRQKATQSFRIAKSIKICLHRQYGPAILPSNAISIKNFLAPWHRFKMEILFQIYDAF